ncbi:MAG: TraR/DksA C4-type zinc finger protein [Myxococcales bacterium]|nr:TraR/DksA C4-type zinc finger protein [Myxococcales bacterium]
MAKEKAKAAAAKPADKAIGAAAFDIENPQSDPDSGLTAKQTRELYDKLRKERQRVLEGVRRHIAEATDPTGPMADEMDQASRDAEQAYLIRYANKERKLLIEIAHALQKMRSGEYGICEGTGEPIGFKRLSIRPWTRYSIQHKEELERRKAERAR